MLNAVEHMNFFEGRATEYSKASTKGSWAEAFLVEKEVMEIVIAAVVVYWFFIK